MTGYFINMTLAALVASGSYIYKWWLPAIIFPVWILLTRITPLQSEASTIGHLYAVRWYFYILATFYMIGQAVIFQVHLGSWYGWIVGLLIGWLVGGVVAGKLEPILLHRES